MVSKKNYLANEDINYDLIKVVDSNGEFLGVMNKKQALKIAFDSNLDLVLINVNSNPPVAKITNFDKFKYEMKKKEKDLKRKNRILRNSLKEVNIRVNTGERDLDRIKNRIEEWLNEGNRVKINLLMRGREIKHKSLAIEFLKKFVSEIKNFKHSDNDIKESSKGLYLILNKTNIQSHPVKKTVTSEGEKERTTEGD